MDKTDTFTDLIKNNSVKDGINHLYLQVALIWDSEKRFLDWYGIKKSTKILDIGCGPGFIIEKLCEFNPNAFITGIDLNADLIEYAKNLLSEKKPHVSLFIRNALNTGFMDKSFNFVYARLLFQHISEPILVAKEIWRILEPGGKVVIFDADEDLIGLNDPKLPFEDEMKNKYKKLLANSTTNHKIGRNLPRVLKQAGFVNIKFDVVAIHSDLVGFTLFKEFVNPTNPMQVHLIKTGIVTKEEIENQYKYYENFFASSESKSISLIVMVYGEKN